MTRVGMAEDEIAVGGLERFREHFAALDGQRALLETIGSPTPGTGVQVALDCLPALHAAVHKAEDESGEDR